MPWSITNFWIFLEFVAASSNLAEILKNADTVTALGWLGAWLGVTVFFYFLAFPSLALALGVGTYFWPRSYRFPSRFLGFGSAFEGFEEEVPSSPNEFRSHLERLRNGLPGFLVLLLVIGLVPFLGAVLGLALYLRSPVAALRGHLRGTDLGVYRWILPLVTLGLVGGQPLPVLGPACIPLLCVVHHAVYDAGLRRRIHQGSENNQINVRSISSA